MPNCLLLNQWPCTDCDKKYIHRNSLRKHLKEKHGKIMCRCGICINEAKGGKHFNSRFCQMCSLGQCSQCGSGTRL